MCETGKSRAKQWTFASPRDNNKPERKNGGSKQVCVPEEMEPLIQECPDEPSRRIRCFWTAYFSLAALRLCAVPRNICNVGQNSTVTLALAEFCGSPEWLD